MTEKKELVRHPWDQWFARKNSFRLTKGKQYNCQTHAMAQQLRTAAGAFGVRVRLRINTDQITVKIIQPKISEEEE